MVVGKKEKSDVKYDRNATIIINGNRYNKSVYGDKAKPNRRDIFAPDVEGKLPSSATVKWMGERYNAKLSFRYGKGGRKIPVYQYFV